MYGFEIIQLKHLNQQSLKLSEIPLISTFNVLIKGNLDNPEFYIKLEAEEDNADKVRDKLDRQRKNLKLYLNLITEKYVDVISINEPEIHHEKKIHDPEWQKSLELLQNPTISKFVNNRHTPQDVLLQIGLDQVFGDEKFDGFSKLVNWLDDNDHKGASRFCKIRDVCSHGVTDDAILKVEEIFPGEFEFESNVLIRNSQKNIQHLKKYLPEVLEHIKQIFKEKLVKNS